MFEASRVVTIFDSNVGLSHFKRTSFPFCSQFPIVLVQRFLSFRHKDSAPRTTFSLRAFTKKYTSLERPICVFRNKAYSAIQYQLSRDLACNNE